MVVTDHLRPLFADIFPDSKIAKNYGSARTKMSCILNGALTPYCKESELIMIDRLIIEVHNTVTLHYYLDVIVFYILHSLLVI